MKEFRAVRALVAALAIVGSVVVAPANAGDLKISFAAFAGPDAPFWKILYSGAAQAAKDLDVQLDWAYPDKFTVGNYNQKLQQIIASKPDGIVIMDIEAGQVAIAKQAKASGIVVVANPSPPKGQLEIRPADDPYVNRIGAAEYAGGQALGKLLLSKGLKSAALCVIQENGNDSLVQRCNGVKDALKAVNVTMDVQFTPNNDGSSSAAKTLVSNYLRAHPETGAVVTLGGLLNVGSTQAINELKVQDKVMAAGFDLDPDTLAAIKQGRLVAVVDQQPWWRGYMSVLALVHYKRYGLSQANYFLTGPSLVTKDNVDQILALSAKNIR